MRLVPLAAGLLLTVAAPSPPAAPAPVPDPAALQREIDGARDLLRLAQATPGGSDRLAGFEARLQRLEEELRRLTGRLEELEYRQRRLEQALTAAPSPPPAATAGEAAAGEAVAGDATPAPREAAEPLAAPDATGRVEGPAAPPPEPDAAARRGYVLGTLPADALREPPASPAEGAAAATAPAGASPEARYEAALALLESGVEIAALEEGQCRLLAGRDLLLPPGLRHRRLGTVGAVVAGVDRGAARPRHAPQAGHGAGRHRRP